MVFENSIELAWYVGIIGNTSFASIAIFLAIILAKMGTKKKDKVLFVGSISVLAFAAMLLSIVWLYLSQYAARKDFFPDDTSLPTLMWLLNIMFTVSVVITSITRFAQWDRKNITGVVLLTAGLFGTGIKMNNYIVYWRNGAILVYYVNKQAEQLNAYLTLLGIAWAFSLALFHLLNLREQITLKVYSEKRKLSRVIHDDFNSTFFFLISTLSLGGIFFIPRTNPGSITNPVNVKIIGYVFFAFFLVFYAIGLGRPEKIFDALRKRESTQGLLFFPTIRISRKSGDMLLSLIMFNLLLFSTILVAMKFLSKPITVQPIATEEVQRGNAIYLFKANHIFWYASIVGGIIPFLIAVFSLAYLFKRSNKLRILRNFSILYSIEFLASLALNFKLLNNQNNIEIGATPVFQHLLLMPVLIASIVFVVDQKQWKKIKENFQSNSPEKALLINDFSPLLVYSVSVFVTITIDFFIGNSPTGKLLIGGAGIFDGIVIVPAQATLFFATFLLVLIYFLSYFQSSQLESKNSDELFCLD